MNNVIIAGSAPGAMALPIATTIDNVNDYLPIYTENVTATQAINLATLLGITGTSVGTSDSQTLTNKTLTSPTINGGVLGGTFTGSYILGGTPTFPSSVATLTGTQTLTNKTFTNPTINSPNITNATITADTLSGFTASTSGTIYGIAIASGQITSNLTLTGTETVTGLLTASNGFTVTTGAITLNGTIGGTGYSLKTIANPSKFSAYNSTNQPLSGTTQVVFDTEDYDTGSDFASNTFTARIAGFYWFNVSMYISSATVTVTPKLYKNGSAFRSIGSIVENSSNSDVIISGSIEVQLAANDTIAVYVTVASESLTLQGATGVTPVSSYFQGEFRSAT